MHAPIQPPPRRILVIHVTRIGDTLLATPTLRALARAWPEAEITCLAHPKRHEVLAGLPFIHRLGAIDKRRARWRGHLPGHPYDLALVFGHDRPLIRYALRVARRVVAFRQGDPELDRRLFRTTDEPAFQSCHAVEFLGALLAPLGLAVDDPRLAYRVLPEEAQWAAARLAEWGLEGRRPLVGLQLASFPTKGYRDWPPEQFAELCERILGHSPGAHFLIFGGPLERPRTLAFQQRFAACATHLAGELSLRQTAALMARLDLYVGVDTGPTHIMGALDRPLVALYHPSSPSTLLAPRNHPCLWAVDHPAAGGGFHPEVPMAGLGVERVWEAVREALEQGCPRAADGSDGAGR